MTKEEAIQILSTRDVHGVLCGYTSGVTEALDMAIKVLSAETSQNLVKPNNDCEVDLISREDAIAYIDRVTNSGLGKNKSLEYIRKYISALPSADRPKGEWIDSKEQKILLKKWIDRGEDWKVCSVCGWVHQVGEWVKHQDKDVYQEHSANYCPCCGADMRGGGSK